MNFRKDFAHSPSKWFEDYYKEEVSNEEYNKRFGITECDESEWNELKKTNKVGLLVTFHV